MLPDRLLQTDLCFMEAVNTRKALGTLNLVPVTLCAVQFVLIMHLDEITTR